MRLSELGELGLLDELARRGLVASIADDAAQLSGGLIVTLDLLLEGVHFELDRISWRELGFRAAAVNLSDLAACGADPEALLVGLALPGHTELADVVELYEGIGEAGVRVVGGDTSAGERVLVAVTALGRAARVPGRGGAHPGDLLVVTGPLGAAGSAFREGRVVRPPLRIEEGKRLASHAHAMLDISDGLGIDVRRLATASGCKAVIELERVPLGLGATIDDLGFGEDYELLAAVAEAGEFTVIGRCEEGSGVEARLEGLIADLGGWEHFAAAKTDGTAGA